MTRKTIVAALLIAVLPLAAGTVVAQANPWPARETQVPSFDLWCLEFQLFPAARCKSRNSVDTRAYEHYRALAEHFAQERADRERHDQEIISALNHDPFDIRR